MIFKSNFTFADSDIQSLSVHDVVGILQQTTKDSISSIHFSSLHHGHLQTLCLDLLNAMCDQGLDPGFGQGGEVEKQL